MAEIQTIIITNDDNKKRLDVFIVEYFKNKYPRAKIASLIDDGVFLGPPIPDEQYELTKDMKVNKNVTDELSEFDIPFDIIKNTLKEMKVGIKGMNEKEFFEYINSDYVPYWLRSIAQGSNKKQIDTILDNLEKIGNNIPQKDLEEIFETIKKVVEKDPQKAMELLKDPKNIKNALLTKGIKKVGAITAGTWAALNFVVTFAIESYLAKLQKGAGRLGVMKAMQELDDERFYANSEVDTQNKQVEPAKTTNVENKYLL